VTTIDYEASPTVAAFMKSDASFRLIAGPVGSGKTIGCMMEFLRRACEQDPDDDGIRRTRFAIVRQTLQQLKMTVLKDIMGWFRGIAEYKVSESTVYFSFGDVRSEWLLIPLEDPEDQKRLLSSQLTGAWMSECIEIDIGLIGPLRGRCGRYPKAPSWVGVIADTNMPTDGSDWHRLMALEKPAGWDVFTQPGGLEPDAENLNWLMQTQDTLRLPIGHPDRVARGRLYYTQLLDGTTDDYQRRYVHAKYGNDPSGAAVFKATFSMQRHVGHDLQPVPGYPLIVAQDFGRNPCALITQPNHRGQLLVLKEIVSEGMGLEKHINEHLRPALMEEMFLGRQFYIVGDPAGTAQNSSYEETSFTLFERAGMNAFPAPTNQIDKRLRAVEAFLLGVRGDGAALVVDADNCPKLVRAMNGMYRFKKMKSGQMAPLPEKLHPWSDLADALQYACLTAHNGYSQYIANRLHRHRMKAPPKPVFSARAWT